MKNVRIRLGAAMLALVMCFGLLVSCSRPEITLEDVKKDPHTVVVNGGEMYAERMGDRYDDVFGVFDKLATGTGTYDLTLSVPEAADVNLNAVVDAKNSAYSVKATMGVMGVNTEASLWGDKNNIAIGIPAAFGDKAYGMKLDGAENDVDLSEFFESVLGISYEELINSLGIPADEIIGMFSADTWIAAFKKCASDSKIYLEGKETVITEENYKIGESEVPVIAVEYTFTAEDLKKLAVIAADMLESICGKLFEAAGISTDELMAETDLDNAAIPEDGIKVKYYMNKYGYLVATDVKAGDSFNAVMVFGEDPGAKVDMSLKLSAMVYDEKVEYTVSVKEQTEPGKSGFDADLTVKMGEDTNTARLSFVKTDADGKYELKLTADGEELVSAAGAVTHSADEFKFTLDSVKAYGETAEIGLSLSVKAGGTVEKVPEYDSIVAVPLDKLGALLSSLAGSIDVPEYGY